MGWKMAGIGLEILVLLGLVVAGLRHMARRGGLDWRIWWRL